MENYILSLIKENNRVIVPNFGAFIVAKENGFSVLFNNFLSFNDGLLVDYIVEQEGIERAEAEQKVDSYVQDVKRSLDASGAYNIEGLGTFTKDATGILRFEQSLDLNSDQAAPFKSPSPADNEELLDIDNNDSGKELSDGEPAQLPETSLNEQTPIAEFEEEDVVEDEKHAKVDNERPSIEAKVSEKAIAGSASKYYIDDEDKGKRKQTVIFFWLLFVLLPLIGFSVYFFFFRDNQPAETKQQIATEIREVPAPDNDLPADNSAVAIEEGPTEAVAPAEPAKKEEVTKPVEEPKVNKPHQLIVGSFSSEANAQRMIQNLHKKGYAQAFWFKHNNHYLVSLEPFAHLYEAQARQEEILQGQKMESWIITKRD
ncbi:MULTISPECIES: SPOR domain-containing protein [unclassified Carboxylicivirga]|uniref:SPOR domain-containing protein n=1 Tax=Carboxylicivirga TaxID=1628153 RepID=UPI003D32EB6B